MVENAIEVKKSMRRVFGVGYGKKTLPCFVWRVARFGGSRFKIWVTTNDFDARSSSTQDPCPARGHTRNNPEREVTPRAVNLCVR